MKLKRFSARVSIMISAVILGGTLFFNQGWSINKSKELAQIEQELQTLKLKVEADQLVYQELTKRAPASVETGIAGQLLEQYLKYNGRFSGVVNGIVGSSTGHSFALTKILSESQIQAPGYTQTLYSVEAEASFIAIGKFLEKLEDSPLLTEVDSIEISRIGAEMKKCKAKIKLYSYVGTTL